MKTKMNKKGFTLVELIIVMAVMAILAAIAVPSISGITAAANKKADDANVALFKNAIELSNAASGSYPNTASTAQTAITTYTNLTSVPDPKQSGHEYYYNTTTPDVRCANASPGAAWEKISP